MTNYVTIALSQYETQRNTVTYEIMRQRTGASRRQIHADAGVLEAAGLVQRIKGARGKPSRVRMLVSPAIFKAIVQAQEAE